MESETCAFSCKFFTILESRMEEKIVKAYISEKFSKENSGHNLDHILRVVENTKVIGKEENLSKEELNRGIFLAYLHEMLDHKLIENEKLAKDNLKELLLSWQVKEAEIPQWIQDIQSISFSKRTKENKVPQYVRVVQDADLLEAIGAMGIIRTITYGAVKNRVLYDEKTAGVKNSSTIQHFYDKLLKIPDYLSTSSGKRYGKKRMEIMEEFLEAFHEEWRGLK